MQYSSAEFICPICTMEKVLWLCLLIISLIIYSDMILVLCTTTSVCSTLSVKHFHNCLGVTVPSCVFSIWCYHLLLVLTHLTLLLAALKHSLDELRILNSPDQSFCQHILVCGDYVDLQFVSLQWFQRLDEVIWCLKLPQWAYTW